MMGLMGRRRALMMAQIGGENMVPGKTITITSNVTKGDNAKSAANSALAAAGITTSGVAFTTKKQSTWATREFVGFTIYNGVATDLFRRKFNTIQMASAGSQYDFVCQSGQTFYVLEAIQ